jgi:hypothetical protein
VFNRLTGLPTTATVPAALRRTAMRSIGTAISAGAAIRHHVETPRLLRAQRNRGAVDPHFQRIPAERAAQERELGTFDEAEHHQSLHRGIDGVDRFDTGAITGVEIRESQKSAPRQRRK